MQRIWEGILQLKTLLEQTSETVNYCAIHLEKGTAQINATSAESSQEVLVYLENIPSSLPANCLVLQLQSFTKLVVLQEGEITADKLLFLKKYIPYCFLSLVAKCQQKAIVVAHFAQTLDGKIATPSGDAKWIGNQENLVHAHRMRALCQGIAVGSRTVEADKPKLTVRLVKGQHPTRIIIGHPSSNFDSLLQCADAPIWVFHNRPLEKIAGVNYQQLPLCNQGNIDTEAIVRLLYKLGIYTVYLEGGALTTAHFLAGKQVAILQLHIAPLLFGSGTSSIQLPAINKVGEALTFTHSSFLPFGDAMMFTGDLF